MKTTKLLLIALVLGAVAASSAVARTVPRVSPRTSIASSRTAGNWNHYRPYRPRSNFYFSFGYPSYGYGYGYPYHAAYPYDYGYYTPRTVYMERAITDDATVAAVQRRLARAGYYHGSIDGVIGAGTRNAIRAFESNNGLPVDGVIDRQLLRTMGLS